MNAAYMEQLGSRSDLIDSAYEVLQNLRDKSRLAMVTNGLQVVQRNRLVYSTLKDFTEVTIISEEVGAAKP